MASCFHNPDLSWRVLGRRATGEIIDYLFWVAALGLSGGRSLLWRDWSAHPTTYYMAIARLKKSGLIVSRTRRNGKIVLDFSAEAAARQPPWATPKKYWNRKWNGFWYVLVYDVPESRRVYRNALRRFLEHQRMGCLQKSVWVTPHDVRPEYDDLARAAEVEQLSFLFEARTVLGRETREVVSAAWDFTRLTDLQDWFCTACHDGMMQIGSNPMSEREVMALVREEMTAYGAVMSGDPLLPRELWPADYSGEKAYRAHLEFLRAAIG